MFSDFRSQAINNKKPAGSRRETRCDEGRNRTADTGIFSPVLSVVKCKRYPVGIQNNVLGIAI